MRNIFPISFVRFRHRVYEKRNNPGEQQQLSPYHRYEPRPYIYIYICAYLIPHVRAHHIYALKILSCQPHNSRSFSYLSAWNVNKGILSQKHVNRKALALSVSICRSLGENSVDSIWSYTILVYGQNVNGFCVLLLLHSYEIPPKIYCKKANTFALRFFV